MLLIMKTMLSGLYAGINTTFTKLIIEVLKVDDQNKEAANE